MSKYTTELRFICEHLAGLGENVGYAKTADVVKKARPEIFDFSYPIFDENYRNTLETKIIKHFYTREIGLETYGLWKLKLDTKMNEIMPYYNKLYETELIKFNPLYDTDIHVEGHRDEKVDETSKNNTTNSGTDSGSRTSTDSGTDTGSRTSTDSGTDARTKVDKTNTWDLYSDTPQGGVNGIQGAEDDPSLIGNGYLTNARHILGDTTGSGDSTTYGKKNVTSDSTTYGKKNVSSDSTTYGRKIDNDGSKNTIGDIDYTEYVYGYRGRNPSASLLEFRKTLLNIDMQVIKDLEELFFQLW